MSDPSATQWKATLVLPMHLADGAGDLLQWAVTPEPVAVSTIELEEGETWAVEAYYLDAPEEAELEKLLSPYFSEFGLDMPEFQIEQLPDVDWVAKSLEGLKPIESARFFVHGAHDRNLRPAGKHTLQIEAGLAFGTGHHPTTFGCLSMLEEITRRRKIRNALDLGCGTGLLALALAKLTGQKILASDIDPIAVKVTKENAKANGLGPLIEAVPAAGFAHRRITEKKPFDLIVANILARPLVSLARDMEQHLAPGGEIVLAGILNRQGPMVESAFRDQGLKLRGREVIGDWVILHLQG
ncbi:50S ribosomal protein L11 methyltransferase [Tepidicaulis sp. LMO-SS28]|uniref:50S ribosomal protein L11 methyltransferase n=1 Tax=Tepidicaulis sp. LMO-SS28 TaxID=3447455 RepID=UPI003EE114FA